jgi:hypothetical protein
LFLFVGVDLELHLAAVAVCDGFEHIAQRGDGETIASDQNGDIVAGEDELEAQVIGAEFRNLELSGLWIVDHIDRDVLEEIPQAFCRRLHGATMYVNGTDGKHS